MVGGMHSDVKSAQAIGVVPRVFVGVVEGAERGLIRCSHVWGAFAALVVM